MKFAKWIATVCESYFNEGYKAAKKVTACIKMAQSFFFKVFSKNVWLEVWFMKLIEAASFKK